ncbi:MAG: hypothetical protein ACW98F_08210 [Candidatus Hodarchaeales archaeon]
MFFKKEKDEELNNRVKELENKLDNLIENFQKRALLGSDHSSEEEWGFFSSFVSIDGELHSVWQANYDNKRLRTVLSALMDYLGVEYVEEMVKEIRKKKKDK